MDNRQVKSAFIENLKARIAVAENNPQKVAQQYDLALQQYPENRALIYGYADHFWRLNKQKKWLN